MRDKNNNCISQWGENNIKMPVAVFYNKFINQISLLQNQIERLQRDVKRLQNPSGDSE